MVLDTLMVMFRRLIRREQAPREPHQAKPPEPPRTILQHGIEIGEKRHVAIFQPCCDLHQTRLTQEKPYGVYICPLCQLQQQAEAVERARHWQPEPEVHTDPRLRAGERPFMGYLRRKHSEAQDTEALQAIRMQQPKQQ